MFRKQSTGTMIKKRSLQTGTFYCILCVIKNGQGTDHSMKYSKKGPKYILPVCSLIMAAGRVAVAVALPLSAGPYKCLSNEIIQASLIRHYVHAVGQICEIYHDVIPVTTPLTPPILNRFHSRAEVNDEDHLAGGM